MSFTTDVKSFMNLEAPTLKLLIKFSNNQVAYSTRKMVIQQKMIEDIIQIELNSPLKTNWREKE